MAGESRQRPCYDSSYRVREALLANAQLSRHRSRQDFTILNGSMSSGHRSVVRQRLAERRSQALALLPATVLAEGVYFMQPEALKEAQARGCLVLVTGQCRDWKAESRLAENARRAENDKELHNER